jgi:branched-chain amino acid transport system permease protein
MALRVRAERMRRVLAQILANGLVAGCFYALVATGFGLIYSTTRVFHIAYGATYVIAPYVCHYAADRFGCPLPLAAAIAIAATAGIGLAIEAVVYAPLEDRRAHPLILLLTSLGLYIVLTNTVALIAGNGTLGLRLERERAFRAAGLVLTDVQLLEMAIALVLLPCFIILLRTTRLGRHVRAIRDDPALGAVIGISERRTRLFVFAFGSAFGGIAAILAALDTGIDPNAGLPILLVATVAVVVGGIHTFEGPLIGGIALGLVRAPVIWFASARWLESVTFAVLLVFLVFRPRGLLGPRTRVEEASA